MNQNFGGQQSTTVTTTRTITNPSIRWDPYFLKTFGGIVKASIVGLSLLSFIAMSIPPYYITLFKPVSLTSFWFVAIIFILYLFHIIEKFSAIPWLKIELGFSLLFTILFAVVSSMTVPYSNSSAYYSIASFFGYCAMVAHGLNAWHCFKNLKSGGVAQGQRHTSQVTTTNSSA